MARERTRRRDPQRSEARGAMIHRGQVIRFRDRASNFYRALMGKNLRVENIERLEPGPFFDEDGYEYAITLTVPGKERWQRTIITDRMMRDGDVRIVGGGFRRIGRDPVTKPRVFLMDDEAIQREIDEMRSRTLTHNAEERKRYDRLTNEKEERIYYGQWSLGPRRNRNRRGRSR